MNIDTILGSIVIGGIISGLVSYLISKRQGNLQYITAERKEWREKVREIAYKLNGASYENTLLLLTALKVRINAFGNNGVVNRYANDAHIWELINEIEIKKPSVEVLALQQKKMIEYLSLLLKVDWERSKIEVKGNLYKFLSSLILVAAAIYFAISIFYYNQNTYISAFDLLTIVLIYILMVIFSSALFIAEVKITCSRVLKGTTLVDKKQYSSMRLVGCYLLWGGTILTMLLIYMYAINSIYSSIWNGNRNDFSILLSTLIYLFGMIVHFIYQTINIDNEFYYNSSINMIRAIYLRKNNENTVPKE